MAKNRKIIIASLSVLLTLLGLTLGGSITAFIFFLNSHEDSLIIFSYLCILAFIIILIGTAILIYRSRNILLTKEKDNYEKQE